MKLFLFHEKSSFKEDIFLRSWSIPLHCRIINQKIQIRFSVNFLVLSNAISIFLSDVAKTFDI